MGKLKQKPVQKIDDYRWKLPQDYKEGMRVPGIIYANRKIMEAVVEDQSLEQVANVATLPGIVIASLAMPDIHWGYGFPIGGVAATSIEDGVISPGGIGFDINCGVRLLRTNLTFSDVHPRIEDLVGRLFATIPTGVGSSGKLKLGKEELKKVMTGGALWAVNKDYGWKEDLENIEGMGRLTDADPDKVSKEAIERGADQLGTLGSGNHFIEIQFVEEVYREDIASVLGIFPNSITVLIHSGSRGFGHQIATDYIALMGKAIHKYGINLPDRQLACAPVSSPEGQAFLGALSCAANYAWANRQCLSHWTREAFEAVFGCSSAKLEMKLIYDVAHNIAKIEKQKINGREKKLCIHRKGAARALPPGHEELPEQYKSIGQPVPVPGDMGRYSYIMVGTKRAMEETFGCTCHGAGRAKSRSQAKREVRAKDLLRELESRGIVVRASSRETLTEEAPIAYKDVEEIVDVAEGANISLKVAKLRPIGVIKG